MVATLAGVRGAVTLAGVMTLPLVLATGAPFPARDLVITLAAGVIVMSLAIASLGLPHALRGLEMPPEPSQQAAEDRARIEAAEAAIAAIEAAVRTLPVGHSDTGSHTIAARRLVDVYRERIERYDSDERNAAQRGRGDAIERQFRLAALRAERDVVTRLARDREIEELTRRKLVRELDFHEARLGGG